MTTVQKMALLGSSLLLFLFSVNAQAQRFVQHEVGAQLNGGMNWVPYNDGEESGPYFGGQFQYNALVANGHLVFGVGLGYSNRGWVSNLLGTDDQGNDLSFYFFAERKGIVRLPLSIGYRSQSWGPHDWFANAIIAPTYLVHYNYQYPLNINRDQVAVPTIRDTDQGGLDLGLEVGYRLQISDNASLQISVTTIYEAISNTDNNNNYQLLGGNLGFMYSL